MHDGRSQLAGFLQPGPAVGVAGGSTAGLEPQVADRSGRHVDEDAFALDLVVADVAADYSADAVQPASLPAAGERRLQLADEDVLVIGQRPTRFEEAVVGAEDLADLRNGEVVQRQTGDDVVVDA